MEITYSFNNGRDTREDGKTRRSRILERFPCFDTIDSLYRLMPSLLQDSREHIATSKIIFGNQNSHRALSFQLDHVQATSIKYFSKENCIYFVIPLVGWSEIEL